jgi:hypothetical protein
MAANKFLEGAVSNLNALQLSIGQLYHELQNTELSLLGCGCV